MSVDAVLIAGPTASGKSAAALELAEACGGIVINADSMQVYSELRVLTARPGPEDEARVPHRLYGHVGVREPYSAGRYEEDAARALRYAVRERRVPIFVGGTGLYFAVLTDGLSPIPAPPAEIREANRMKLEAMGHAAFFARLAARDPETAQGLRAGDTQRLLRAADVRDATGMGLASWRKIRGRAVLQDLKLARFVIAPPRDVLAARIASRFDAMVAKGGLEEAHALRSLDPRLPAAKALGLPQLLRHLAGEWDLSTAMEDAKMATRRYVKRQLTWARTRMADWKWLEDARIRNTMS
jgi:tRNA dimethylallyltransferase